MCGNFSQVVWIKLLCAFCRVYNKNHCNHFINNVGMGEHNQTPLSPTMQLQTPCIKGVIWKVWQESEGNIKQCGWQNIMKTSKKCYQRTILLLKWQVRLATYDFRPHLGPKSNIKVFQPWPTLKTSELQTSRTFLERLLLYYQFIKPKLKHFMSHYVFCASACWKRHCD